MADNRYTSAFTITPSDSADQPAGLLAIYVGGTGTVCVVARDGSEVIFAAVPVGTILPIAAKRVKSTNTSATLLIGLTA